MASRSVIKYNHFGKQLGIFLMMFQDVSQPSSFCPRNLRNRSDFQAQEEVCKHVFNGIVYHCKGPESSWQESG